MMRQIAWKECREGVGIGIVMAALGVLALLFGPRLADVLNLGHTPEEHHSFAALMLLIITVAHGIIAGSMTLAGERESGTQFFLDQLWPRRRDLWERKLRIGALMALAQGILLGGLSLIDPDYRNPGSPLKPSLLPLLSLEGFIWGMLGSALCRTVLMAAFVGTVLGALSWLVTAGFAMLLGGWMVAALRIGFDVWALVISARLYCQTDAEWRTDKTKAAKKATWGPIRATLWLVGTQCKREATYLGASGFVIGLFVGQYYVYVWPLLTLLTGVVIGTGLWADEQTDGSRRFLADQRLSLTKLWLVKTIYGLAVAVPLGVWLLLGTILSEGLRAYVNTGEQDALIEHLLIYTRNWSINWRAILIVWVVTGFAAGQFFMLVCHKRLIAVVVAFCFSAMLAVAWLPSMVTGGLTIVHVLFGPIVLLLATRFVLAAWTTEGLGQPRPVVILVVSVLLAISWQALSLARRAHGVRDVGEPFDVAAHQAELRELEKAESAQLIRKALGELLERRKQLGPIEGMSAAQVTTDNQIFLRVLHFGWANAAPNLGPWLDQLFAGDWPTLLHRGVNLPPGVIENPRGTRLLKSTQLLDNIPSIVQLFVVRAEQLQATKREEAALTLLLDLLAFAGQLDSGANGVSLDRASNPFWYATSGIRRWASRTDSVPLLRRALAEVQRAEARLPSFTMIVKNEYLDASGFYTNVIQDPKQLWSQLHLNSRPSTQPKVMIAQLLEVADALPWERERRERFIRYQFGRQLGTAAPDARLDRQFRGSVTHQWLEDFGFKWWRTVEVSRLRQLRLLQIQLAAQLFRREHGQLPISLNQLTPDILKTPLIDPVTGQPFSALETILRE